MQETTMEHILYGVKRLKTTFMNNNVEGTKKIG